MQPDQSEAQPRSVISMEFLRSFLRRHFAVETSGGVTKCRLFSQAQGAGKRAIPPTIGLLLPDSLGK